MNFGNTSTTGAWEAPDAREHHYFSYGYSPFPRDSKQAQSYILPAREYAPDPGTQTGMSVDDLIGRRTDILATKLDVLTTQMHERLNLRTRHTHSLDYDECSLGTAMNLVYVQSGRYIQGADRRITGLQKQGFDIHEQRRKQDVECWRDVAMLTRDFLGVWEAYQKAKAKAELMRDVSL